MSSNLTAIATPVAPGPKDPHPLSRQMRVSLSVLRSSAATHLTQRDIQTLQNKGFLGISTTQLLQDSSSSSINSQQDCYSESSAASASGSSAVTSRASLELSVRPPLPIAERVAPMMGSLRPRLSRSAKPKGNRPGEDPRLVIHPKERPLRPYHQGIIEDTCSHLHAPTSVFRRHSDSSSPLVLSAASSREDTLAFDPIRRASIATASMVGGRTVLYKASHAHTLLSLPSQTAMASVIQTRDQFSLTAPSLEMSSFRFPADENRPQTPPSPALSTTSAMSPTMAVRSKRKSSIPIRSPNANDSPDAAPGIIFQFPFGTPPMPSLPYRKSSTPSALPLSSPSASPSQFIVGRSSSPSTSRDDGGFGISRSGSETQGFQDQEPPLFETPRSPASRSGLGIQVRESFAESDTTHPLESSSTILTATNIQTEKESQTQSHTRLITPRSEEDSEMSIGDIVVTEQEHQETQSEHASGTSNVDQTQSYSIPTPPPTSKVQFMRVMETTPSQLSENPLAGSSANVNSTSPPTPFTPGFGFAMR